jgi:uncharacterized protein YeaC (DUF1315 family)
MVRLMISGLPWCVVAVLVYLERHNKHADDATSSITPQQSYARKFEGILDLSLTRRCFRLSQIKVNFDGDFEWVW